MRRRAAVAGAALLALAGCAQSPSATNPSGAHPVTETNVQVDTAALRAAKKAADVEPCTPGSGRGTPQGRALPHLTLPCLGGGKDVALDRLRGPMVVNLFAQWCGPCRSEMPYYQQLHEKAKGRLQVLGIDYLDTQPARALQLVKQSGVTYPLLADPAGDLRAALRIRGLPGVVLVDAKGHVVDVEFRVIRSYAELRTLVRDKLGVRLPQ